MRPSARSHRLGDPGQSLGKALRLEHPQIAIPEQIPVDDFVEHGALEPLEIRQSQLSQADLHLLSCVLNLGDDEGPIRSFKAAQRKWRDQVVEVSNQRRGRYDAIVQQLAGRREGNKNPLQILHDRAHLVPGPLYHNAPFAFSMGGLIRGNHVIVMTRFDALEADIGWMDEDGYLYLADRQSDMVLSGGANIYPAEIESALDAHPQVRSSAVIGMPDDDLGQRLHAIVQVEGQLTDDDLREHMAERLVRYKVPRTFEYVDEPLRDDAGKMRRSELLAERIAAMEKTSE